MTVQVQAQAAAQAQATAKAQAAHAANVAKTQAPRPGQNQKNLTEDKLNDKAKKWQQLQTKR